MREFNDNSYQQLDLIYLKKKLYQILWIKEERILSEKIEDIKKGYPEEYLNLYKDDKKLLTILNVFLGISSVILEDFTGILQKKNVLTQKKHWKSTKNTNWILII